MARPVYHDPFTLEEAMCEIRYLRKVVEARQAEPVAQVTPASIISKKCIEPIVNIDTLPDHSYLYAAPPAQAPADAMSVRDVIAERRRQIEQEGWTPAHDDGEHKAGELATAGYHYAANAAACLGVQPGSLHIWDNWPWHPSWWKPTTPRRDLVKAGALILAEIDRLDRAAMLAAMGTPTEQKSGEKA
jgi:hypothetical protein